MRPRLAFASEQISFDFNAKLLTTIQYQAYFSILPLKLSGNVFTQKDFWELH